MNTEIISLDFKKPNKQKINKLSEVIKKGGLVAFPTETVYGLGASAFNKKAIKNIFKAKKRPNDNPLIVHISNKKELEKLVLKIPFKAKKLIDRFWPGPLTIVLNKKEIILYEVTGNLETVAIRLPKNKIARELIKSSQVPIVAPSANLSGKPSPTTFLHVKEDLFGKIDAIVKSKKTEIGVESTVIDLTRKVPKILRPGKITKKQIEAEIGKITEHKSKDIKNPASPGMKYKHYSPSTQVIIAETKKEIEKIKKENKNKKIKVLEYKTTTQMGKNLFYDFRRLDKLNYDLIIVKSTKNKHFGVALMDRLKKASSS